MCTNFKKMGQIVHLYGSVSSNDIHSAFDYRIQLIGPVFKKFQKYDTKIHLEI